MNFCVSLGKFGFLMVLVIAPGFYLIIEDIVLVTWNLTSLGDLRGGFEISCVGVTHLPVVVRDSERWRWGRFRGGGGNVLANCERRVTNRLPRTWPLIPICSVPRSARKRRRRRKAISSRRVRPRPVRRYQRARCQELAILIHREISSPNLRRILSRTNVSMIKTDFSYFLFW